MSRPTPDTPRSAAPPLAGNGASLNEGERSWGTSWLVLFLCAAWIVLVRWHTYDEPQERDITWYAVLGHEFLAGRPFYSDLWFHKPPAVKIAYAGAELLFGYGAPSIFFLNVVCGLATLAGVFVATRRLGGGWGVILWAALSNDLWMEANQPNTESFMNACVIWAFVLFMPCGQTGWRLRDILLAGFLTAIGSLFKHIAVLPVVGAAVAYIVWSPGGWGDRGKALAQMASAGLVVVVAWGAMLLYFTRDAVQSRAVLDALFTYNSYYVSSAGNTLSRAFQPLYLGALGIGLLPALCAWLARRHLTPESRRLWAMYAGGVSGAYVAVVLPGRYFAHYFQLLLPWFAVGIGGLPIVLQALAGKTRAGAMRCRMATLLLGAIVGAIALYEASLLTYSATEWSTLKYGPEFVMTVDEGRRIDRMLLPGETFYDFGQSTGLYYISRRTPPTGLMLYDPLLEGPLQLALSQRVLHDLQRTQPEILVVPRHSVHYLIRSSEYVAHELFDYLKDSYVPFPEKDQPPFFALFARRQGRIAGQWSR